MAELNAQQFGKHAAKVTKAGKIMQPSGKVSGQAELVTDRPNSTVNAGYLPKHGKSKYPSDTEPDRAGPRTDKPFSRN